MRFFDKWRAQWPHGTKSMPRQEEFLLATDLVRQLRTRHWDDADIDRLRIALAEVPVRDGVQLMRQLNTHRRRLTAVESDDARRWIDLACEVVALHQKSPAQLRWMDFSSMLWPLYFGPRDKRESIRLELNSIVLLAQQGHCVRRIPLDRRERTRRCDLLIGTLSYRGPVWNQYVEVKSWSNPHATSDQKRKERVRQFAHAAEQIAVTRAALPWAARGGMILCWMPIEYAKMVSDAVQFRPTRPDPLYAALYDIHRALRPLGHDPQLVPSVVFAFFGSSHRPVERPWITLPDTLSPPRITAARIGPWEG